jgi:hypothetical protein
MRLLRLLPEAKRLVVPELASGAWDRPPESAWRPLVEELARPVDLAALDAAIDGCLSATQPFDPAIDALLAPALHRALPLSRREAADPGIWRFLTVVHRPDFVRHRWENKSFAVTRSRFWRPGTRPDSNALARLYWIAELTRDGSSYALTVEVLRRQSLANAIFVRQLCFHRPAVAACAGVLAEAPAELVERALLGLTRFLALVPLEGLSEEDLRAVLRRLVRQASRASG